MWSYSSIMIHGSPLTALKSCNLSGVNQKPPRTSIVCCCPWSGQDTNRKQYYDDVVVKASKVNPPEPPFLPSLGFMKKSQEKIDSPLPPGPSFLHLMSLMHYAVRSFPYHHPLRDLARAYGPLVHVKLGEVSTIVVSSAELAKEVLKTREPACANRPKSVGTQIISYNYTDAVLSPYNDYWKQMRNVIISKFLNTKNVRSMEHLRKHEASLAVKSIQSTCGQVNLSDEISLFMNSVACRAVFGDACLDRRDAYMAVKRGVSVGASFAMADLFPSIKVLEFFSLNKYRMLRLKKKVDKVLDSIIDDHRKKFGKTSNEELDTQNFLDHLIRLKESNEGGFPITDDNIKSIAATMVAAATETSSALVDWAMAELMRNPRVMEKVQKEIRQAFNGKERIQESEIEALKYLKLVIKETLRLHPSPSIITRACREEIEVEGYHIPLDANVIVNAWAIGRDPSYWVNADSFEPERFEASPIDFFGAHFEFIPFGTGKRGCPGIALGLANANYFLTQLLYHFDWKLPPGTSHDDVDMTESDGMVASSVTPPILYKGFAWG